ncbi:MAG TPA: DUF1579 family protein [Gemmatimonadales bacterium]|nr:DUF1579 family protein [Gemmatimonadales bacterium]
MRLALLALSILTIPTLSAQQDGPGRPFQDSLVGQLAGEWSMTGDMRGQPQHYRLKAEWVLSHQFLRLEMQGDQYEAVSYIGYDNASERYVAHWIDIFGGRVSETLGYGKRDGSSIHFVFEYPDGPFRSDYTLDPETGWRIDMTQKSDSGVWKDFAHYRLVRSP